MIGPGKYDAHAQRVAEETGARSVVLIVIEGKNGNGFSVKDTLEPGQSAPSTLAVAEWLESVASEMRDIVRLLPQSVTCPKCGRVSYNKGDIEHRYCVACHQFHAEMKA